MNTMNTEFVYDGKRCVIANSFRTRRTGTSWGYSNTLCLRYADGTTGTVPAGKFHKLAKIVLPPQK